MGIDHPIDRFTTSSITYDDRMIMCKKALEDHPNSIFNQQKNSQQSKNRSITTIGNDVWIGEDVTLARGINIGDGSIVASGAIVTKDVEPYTIVGGVPARLIRPRFDSVTVSELMELRFWDYAFWDFGELSLDSGIGYFISHLRKLIEQNSIKKYSPESISLKSLIDFSE
ncbi:CatB-related O-acetyltransferase [Marinobacterium sp. YM272]|uniref:CatB-related O-acetyltransferase n=1 Tax=Marinobacterium sp. YM272 TaxID=3421654 RepID=UPI003D7FFC8E